MRKILFALPLTLLLACSGNQKKEEGADKSATTTEAVAEKKFACVMQCEGEKTYAKAGKCPVCHMDLQEVALANTDSTEHVH